MSGDHAERVALVTGGSRGIGRACVERLLGAGWIVELCSLRPESVEACLAELSPQWGERLGGTTVDVRDAAAVDAWVADVSTRRGGIDLLVNNAGLGRFSPVHVLSRADWDEVIGTNLDGAFYVLSAVARAMVAAKNAGWIVNIASLAGKSAIPGGAAYNASKFGLIGLSEAAMLDLRPFGIRVVSVLPGSVDTDFAPRTDEERSGMIRAEDIAALVLDLLDTPPRTLPSWIEIRAASAPQR